jgi:membrane protein implicated in regulation of membrane protease activity
MWSERLAWAGSLIMSGVAIYLAWVPVASQLGRWVFVAIAALVILAALLMFPWRRRADGSAARFINNIRVSGRGNRVQSAGDNSTQAMADRDVTINPVVSRGDQR